jgi:hypothetical protein
MTLNVLTPSRPGETRRPRIQVSAVLALIPLVTVLAACGGTSSGTPATQAPAVHAPTQAPSSGGQGVPGTFPGASGLIAAASPGTLQVQSATAQNTVVYNANTKFTRVTPGHVAAGDCIIVTGTPVTGSTKALTATSARIEATVNGACPATSANGGQPGSGSFAQRPPGAPSGAPSAGSRPRRAFASATGTVSSVTGSTILVKGVLRTGPSTTGSSTPASPTTITVTLGTSAAVTQTVPATSAAAVVGQCARAIGPANDVGTITARSITISSPGPNGCRQGVGGRGSFNGGSGANGTGSSGSNV